MKNKRIVIAGGTGFIGQAMAKYFGKDNHVVVLSRKAVNGRNNSYGSKLLKASDGYNITYWRWDGLHVEKHWMQEIEGCDLLINLAGRSVNCRYNERNKQEMINSRVQATQTLGEAVRKATRPPTLWINAASATIYRHATDHAQDEETGEISDWKKDNMPYSWPDRLRYRCKRAIASLRYGKDSEQYKLLDKDFSVFICKQWEQAFFEERTPFTRKVAFRAAVTLGSGGVMMPYFNLLKTGLGGYQGNGQQMYSWIHEEDLCRIVEWCYDQKEAEGVFNCAAPNPVTNTDFMRILRRVTGHQFGLPAFIWMLEMGACLIGTETELVLKSRWVMPERLLHSGFRFKYALPEDAIRAVVEQTPRRQYHLF